SLGNTVATTTTDSSGNYSFSNRNLGNYTIQYETSSLNVNLTGGNSTDNNFVLIPTGLPAIPASYIWRTNVNLNNDASSWVSSNDLLNTNIPDLVTGVDIAATSPLSIFGTSNLYDPNLPVKVNSNTFQRTPFLQPLEKLTSFCLIGSFYNDSLGVVRNQSEILIGNNTTQKINITFGEYLTLNIGGFNVNSKTMGVDNLVPAWFAINLTSDGTLTIFKWSFTYPLVASGVNPAGISLTSYWEESYLIPQVNLNNLLVSSSDSYFTLPRTDLVNTTYIELRVNNVITNTNVRSRVQNLINQVVAPAVSLTTYNQITRPAIQNPSISSPKAFCLAANGLNLSTS
ncbi:MAG: hypothetical protein ACRC80_11350, partial [Waterburya sp.]